MQVHVRETYQRVNRFWHNVGARGYDDDNNFSNRTASIVLQQNQTELTSLVSLLCVCHNSDAALARKK